jgi:hypothetical protein
MPSHHAAQPEGDAEPAHLAVLSALFGCKRAAYIFDIEQSIGQYHGWPSWVRRDLEHAGAHGALHRQAAPKYFPVVLFLLGNGASPRRLAALLVGGNYLSIAKDRHSVLAILKDHRTGAPKTRQWTYWSMLEGRNLVLGQACSHNPDPKRAARGRNLWGAVGALGLLPFLGETQRAPKKESHISDFRPLSTPVRQAATPSSGSPPTPSSAAAWCPPAGGCGQRRPRQGRSSRPPCRRASPRTERRRSSGNGSVPRL